MPSEIKNAIKVPSPPRRLYLDNGLEVVLVHTPAATRMAAAVRVAAGSHDEPEEYPGLAHFLEHLLFLGGHDYKGEQRLMPFVQGHAGQVNASTRARDTHFFFELPLTVAEAGLARMCDMLLYPALDIAIQQREREVLHAEFLLWERDPDTLHDTALSQALVAAHPFLRFHAGNRDSLAIEQPAFQRALGDFHQCYYRAGQMRLVVTGPQSLDALQALAERYGQRFTASARIPQPAPPSLLPVSRHSLPIQTPSDRPRISLFFILEGLPLAADDAIDFLATWLEQPTPGSLLEQLGQHGGVESLRLRIPYRYAGQAIIAIEFFLDDDTMQGSEYLAQAFFSWLRFLLAQDDWASLRTEYDRILARRMVCMPPMARARYWSERLLQKQAAPDSSAPDPATLRTFLAQLSPQRLVKMATCPPSREQGENSTLRTAPCKTREAPWQWRPVVPNPFLHGDQYRARQNTAQPNAALSSQALHDIATGFHWFGELSAHAGQGAVFLRWHLPPHSFRQRLGDALSSTLTLLISQARQAGVDIRFDKQYNQWRLTLIGLAEPLLAVFHDVIERLTAPPAEAWMQGLRHQRKERRRNNDELLIRQLLRSLPQAVEDAYAVNTAATRDKTDGPPLAAQHWAQALTAFWQACRWDGLAVNLPTAHAADVNACLARVPGQPSPPASTARSLRYRFQWHKAEINSTENALLLFCPCLGRDGQHEALWRLLAQCYQNAFFQRLRTELQLGYAVFCGFRQVGDQAGLLFAVQSPHASVAEILTHIEAFLTAQRETLSRLNDAEVKQLCSILSAQLDTGSAGFHEAAERLWQAYAISESNDLYGYRQAMQHTYDTMTVPRLLAGHDALQQATAGWVCLANAERPDTRWRSQAGGSHATLN